MAKLSLTNITSGYGSASALNTNNNAIVTALENTLSRDGTSPNIMTADIDMNSNSLLNVDNIDVQTLSVAGSTLDDILTTSITTATAASAASAAAALVSENNALVSANNSSSSATAASNSASMASTSASNSATSATTSQNAATTALSYTTSGFMGIATLVDLGFVSDATVYFPTDLGVLV